ncbi:hypothetical protein HDU96_008470 [Phlyctochytrium bullatum]|nr:hypothetical protein HDU96_008470 [Phlyctochytrium bullatum]
MSETLLSYALRFPEAARWLWETNIKIQNYLATLSPEVRQKVTAAVAWLAAFSVSVFRFVNAVMPEKHRMLSKAYDAVMAFPGTPPAQWTQPANILLKLLASVVLFVLPLHLQVEEEDPAAATGSQQDSNRRVIYVANSGIFSFDAIPLVASIYQKTGKLPRRVTDHMHFRIPVWKHLIEYLGAIPGNDAAALSSVMAAGHPLLLHPGGRRESFRLKTDPRAMPLWPQDRRDFIELAVHHHYVIVPLASVGPADMIRPIAEVRVDPFLWLLGDREPHPPSAASATVPVPLPVSYQRMYAFASRPVDVARTVLPPPPPYAFAPGFQAPADASGAAVPPPPLDPSRVEEARIMVEGAVRLAVNRASEMQLSDPKRFLLEPLWDAMEGGRQVAKDLGERFEQGLKNAAAAQQQGAASTQGETAGVPLSRQQSLPSDDLQGVKQRRAQHAPAKSATGYGF